MAFNGNKNLRAKNQELSYTKEMLEEYIKCAEDICYFAEKYFYIVTIDFGKMLIPLRDYQKKVLKICKEPPEDRRNIIVLASRQIGKCCFSNTKIKIRNKKTGVIEEVTIGDFQSRIKNEK